MSYPAIRTHPDAYGTTAGYPHGIWGLPDRYPVGTQTTAGGQIGLWLKKFGPDSILTEADGFVTKDDML